MSDAPKTIIWPPDRDEVDEGLWACLRWILIESAPFDMQGAYLSHTEPFTSLLETSQDDTGVIASRLLGQAHKKLNQRRSISQPPPIRRRAQAYCEDIEDGTRKWLRGHLCPADNRWRFICAAQVSRTYTKFSLRRCMRDDVRIQDFQEARLWKDFSFLKEHKGGKASITVYRMPVREE